MDTDILAWVDLETWGLRPQADPIIEMGIYITDFNLNIIMDWSCIVWDEERDKRYISCLPDDKFVRDMHEKSGLWYDAIEDKPNNLLTPSKAYLQAAQFLADYGVTPDKKIPMAGSSVHFDRAMLQAQAPGVAIQFGHRNIDISTLKELCMRLNPEMYAGMKEDLTPKGKHRVLPDLDDTLGEAKWYFDNFLFYEDLRLAGNQ